MSGKAIVWVLMIAAIAGATAWPQRVGSMNGLEPPGRTQNLIRVMRGELTAVDRLNRLFFVRDAAAVEHAFVFDPAADIKDSGKGRRFEGLEPGLAVAVSYEHTDGRRMAREIIIERSA